MADNEQSKLVKVWDIPTRIFHWSLVVLIAGLWWTERSDDIARHKLLGFALLALVVFRIYWGFVGAQTARFSDFVRGPGAIWRFVRGRGPIPAGHSALGGLSVAAMLLVIAVACVSGLFAIDEDGLDAGPFAPKIGLDWAQRAAGWHALAFEALEGLIALHVLAVSLYWLAGRNLVFPMITGTKRLPEGREPPRFAHWWSIAIGVALAAAVFLALWHADS